jgi:hypothetical protein
MRITLVLVLAIAALISGVTAAYYWFRSAQLKWRKLGRLAEPINEAVLDSICQWIFEIADNIKEGAALNKRAAIWTAISVFLSAIASVIGNWPV